ncbi:MAG: proline dehydrogenase family protein [Schleiferiaceae bacterium]|nr:proline dehydrogenase family protein [Schleiferiaceae bacterium]MDR9442875.1 proline dehydrogenase family protein [Schleiferiaceae bacterium]
MINFNDTKTAFALKSDAQLRKASWLFRLVASKSLVGLGKKAAGLAMKLRLPIREVVKQTVYDQFVGGETIDECEEIIKKMLEHNVYSLLDYSIEGKETDADFDRTKDKIVQTIKYGASHEGVPFAVFKPTGVARFAILEKYSAGKPLSEFESRAWSRAKNRIEEICYTAYKFGLKVMIDAEETWIQKAIDDVTREMMERFNQKETVIYNTLQMYRRDRLEYLQESLEMARQKGYHLGVKFVRGAYMEKERQRARELGYPDPINPTKEASDKMYNEGLRFAIDHVNEISFVAGSHNEQSSQLLAQLMDEKGLDRNDRRIWFSQLYGMSDNLSFNLAEAGYNVVKYLPFGPVAETLPYLIRRAEENSAAGGQTSRELNLIEKELHRRGIE